MNSTELSNQLRRDFQSGPPESEYASFYEHLALCFEEADEKLECLYRNLDTFEKYVPREQQARLETIIQPLESLIESLQEKRGEY